MRAGNCKRCKSTLSGKQRKWCSPNCCKRACDDRHRATCVDCGGPLGMGSGFASSRYPQLRCQACQHADENERTAERGHQIERWWAEGLAQSEIARRLGWKVSHVQYEVAQLRAKGFDLPYRYKLTQPKHPELREPA